MTSTAKRRKITKEWMHRLNLSNWIITISDEAPESDESDAQIVPSPVYDQATMKFDSKWRDWSLDYLNYVIVHELVHLLIERLHNAATALPYNVHADAMSLFRNRLDFEMENAVDHLARLFIDALGPVE